MNAILKICKIYNQETTVSRQKIYVKDISSRAQCGGDENKILK